MPSRRSGTRSHHGCQNCKNRHVKCDETLPVCIRCQRRKETCSLSTRPGSTLAPSDSPRASSEGAAAAAEVGSEPDEREFTASTAALLESVRDGTLDHTWLDDMLFHHYVKVASWSLNENPKITAIYHKLVPRMALEHDHLKHSLLSISGAHCVATLSSSQTADRVSPRTVEALIERSLTHQSLALSSFAQAISIAKLTTVPKAESIALTLSSIFVLTSFIAQQHSTFQHATHNDVSALSKAVALLNLQGPIVVFFQQYEEQINASELRAFTEDLPNPGTIGQVHSEEAAKSLARIAVLCADTHLVPSDREKFAEVVFGLGQMSRMIAADPATIGGRFRWVIGETATYLANKLYQRVPEALLLTAHWAACQIPNNAFWGSGFAEALIADIDKVLPAVYAPYIEWPLQQLRQAQLDAQP